MKRATTILALILAAGCARPLYVAKSDAQNSGMRGGVAQVRETLFDNVRDTLALPQTLDEFDVCTVIDYSRAGNITKLESFRGPDSLQFVREEYFYEPSSKGERMVRSEAHNLAKNSVRVLEYGYDEWGNLVSEIERTGSYRTGFRNDRKGYPKSETSFVTGEEGKASRTRYRYDRRGLLISAKGGKNPAKRYTYRPDGTVARIETGKDVVDVYDANGSLVESTNIIKRGRERFRMSITARYEYDARGNWNKRTMYYEGQPQSVAVREIDYYEDR